MAEQDQSPVFQIQRIYLKDLSLEQPNSPQVLLEQTQPAVDIQLSMSAEGIAASLFEVTVTATVTTKVGERVLFLVEAKQAGIFEIRNVPAEQQQGILGVVCPQMLYPYLRAIVSDVCTRAGFPPILLAEVNFQAMFEAQQQAQLAQAASANGAPNEACTYASNGRRPLVILFLDLPHVFFRRTPCTLALEKAVSISRRSAEWRFLRRLTSIGARRSLSEL